VPRARKKLPPAKSKSNTAEKPEKVASKTPKKVREKAEVGYKGHRKGSRKEQVHKVYDEKGAEAAKKLASKLEIADSTTNSWVSEWKYMDKWGK